MTDRSDRPSPAKLWQQAGGETPAYDAGTYRKLLRDHGHLVPGKPEALPCGWTPGRRSTGTPVPSIDPPPGPIEVEARTLHAATCRMELPDITDREILDLWDALPDDGRQWLLDTAHHRIAARAAEPDGGEPDETEALTRRLTGMSPDEVRAAQLPQPGDRLRFDDGDGVHDLVVTGPAEVGPDGMVSFPAANAAARAAADRIAELDARAAGARLLAEGKPTHPRQDDDGSWYDVPCDCRLEPTASTPEELAAAVETLHTAGPVLDRLVLGEPPEHRAARRRTDEEQAALSVPRVGRWVAGKGWVPVDGLGPCEGVAR